MGNVSIRPFLWTYTKIMEVVQKHIFYYWRFHGPKLQTFKNYPENTCQPVFGVPAAPVCTVWYLFGMMSDASLRSPCTGLAPLYRPPPRLLTWWSAKRLKIRSSLGRGHPHFSVHSVLYSSGTYLILLRWKWLLSRLGGHRLLRFVALTVKTEQFCT